MVVVGSGFFFLVLVLVGFWLGFGGFSCIILGFFAGCCGGLGCGGMGCGGGLGCNCCSDFSLENSGHSVFTGHVWLGLVLFIPGPPEPVVKASCTSWG